MPNDPSRFTPWPNASKCRSVSIFVLLCLRTHCVCVCVCVCVCLLCVFSCHCMFLYRLVAVQICCELLPISLACKYRINRMNKRMGW